MIESRPSRLALVVLLVVPAVVVNPWAQDLFDLPKSLAAQCMILCAIASAALSRRHAQLRIQVSSLSIPLVALLLLAGLSAARSLDPLWGFLEVTHLVLLVIVFHLLLDPRGAGGRVALIFPTMAMVGGISALYGLLQLVGLDLIHTEGRFVPYSFFGNPNFAAEFILLVLPPAVGLMLLAQSRRGLILWSLISVLLLVHLAATQTRAALGGLTLGIFGAAVFWRRCSTVPSDPAPSKRRWVLVGSILAMGYLLFVFPQPLRALQPIAARVLNSEGWDAHRVQEMLTRVSPGKALLESGSVRARVLVWKAGLQLIRDHPWTGVGPTNVAVVFPMRYQPVEYWWPHWFGEPFLHNELLQVAAELGLPSLLLVLWILAHVAAILRRSLSTSRPLRDRVWLTAGLCALIAIGVESLFSFPWHLPAHRLYAVIHGASLLALASSEREARGFLIARSSGLALAGALVLLVGLGPLRLQLAEVYAARGWEALNRGAREEALDAYSRAHAWFPAMFQRDALFREALDSRPQYEKAVRQFREALQQRPGDRMVLANLGRALDGAGRLEEARDVFKRLLEETPRDAELLKLMIDLTLRSGRLGEARRLYGQLAEGGGCEGRLLFNIGVGYHLSGERDTARAMWEQAVKCEPRLTGLPEVWLKRFAR